MKCSNNKALIVTYHAMSTSYIICLHIISIYAVASCKSLIDTHIHTCELLAHPRTTSSPYMGALKSGDPLFSKEGRLVASSVNSVDTSTLFDRQERGDCG